VVRDPVVKTMPYSAIRLDSLLRVGRDAATFEFANHYCKHYCNVWVGQPVLVVLVMSQGLTKGF